MKVHKAKILFYQQRYKGNQIVAWTDGTQRYTYCDGWKPKEEVSIIWEPVTCKNCLKHKPKEKKR